MNDTPVLFRAVAATLSANGFRPVPIKPGTKYPGFDDWQHFEYTPGCEERFPDYGCGILLGDVVAVDIDCDDESMAARLEESIRNVLGVGDEALIPCRFGRYPRRVLLFRSDQPFAKQKTASYRRDARKAQVEILGQGQQVVVYGIHPDTGRPYKWRDHGGSPLTVPRANLPGLGGGFHGRS